MQKKLRCAVVGATGLAGQQFVNALENHPWFEIATLAASEKNKGKRYVDALRDHSGKISWFASASLPSQRILEIVLEGADSLNLRGIDLIFTAVESDVAAVLEPMYAEQKPVFSAASFFRYEKDVPLIIPSVNHEHVGLVHTQQSNRGWKGFVLPIPNCTTTGLVASLKPLQKFGLLKVVMTSLQAVSGAGRSPGVIGLDIIDNVIPYIPKEEEKVEKEAKKILGTLAGDKIIETKTSFSCTCTRVAVLDGHTEAVFTSLETPIEPEEASKLYTSYVVTAVKGLPSTPKELFKVHPDPFRPQPRLDRDANDGMTIHIGRLRKDDALKGIKYVVLSHNTKLGAAKGAIWIAELCREKGLLSV